MEPGLGPIFDPESVALFGASERRGSVGAYLLRNLLTGGFEGTVVPVNPRRKTVFGRQCHPTLAAAGVRADLAVVTAPARAVPDIIEDCAAAGTHHAIILSAGFGAHDPDGPALKQATMEAARRSGLRFIGPNCLGLVRPHLGLNATFLDVAPPAGGLALVSQSGAICSTIVDMAEPRGLGFSTVLSLGNSVDVGLGDAIMHLAEDDATSAIIAYVEGVRSAQRFRAAIREAAARKPVIVLKAGRHAAGRRAATTHTDALIGADDVFAAAVRGAGGIQVGTLGDLLAAAEMLSGVQATAGNRLAIVTNGGGVGVLAADRAGDLGIALPEPGEATLRALDDELPAYWSRGNPVDILGDAEPKAYAVAVEACLADPAFDAILVMLSPQAMTDARRVAETILQARLKEAKPIFACLLGEISVRSGRDMLEAVSLPSFTLPERAVEAFACLVRHRDAQHEAGAAPDRAPPPAPEEAREIVAAAREAGQTLLGDIDSKRLLAAFGVPTTVPQLAESAEEAATIAEMIGRPVALKVASPDISHKTEVDGVRLGLVGADQVRRAAEEITATARERRPDARIAGVTVEPMADLEGGREVLLGLGRDPVFGPVITFGAGGTLVEVMKDSDVALPPLDRPSARRLIGRTRIAKALGEFRGRDAADLDALADALVAVSDLAMALPEVEGLDMNPVIAAPGGILALDVRVKLTRD